MRSYAAIFNARFKVLVQYRAAALAAMSTQLFWGFVRMMIFTAFFKYADYQAPISLNDTITYIWIGQALLQLMPWTMDAEIQQIVRTGNVAYELVRPVDLYGLWYARAAAMRFTPTALRCIPIFVLATAFGWLQPPEGLLQGIAFVITTFAALLLGSAITTILMISLFWTISGEGLIKIAPPLILFLSGLFIPLPLMPDWARAIAEALPFRGIIDIPIRLYTGITPISAFWMDLGFQLFWTVVLVYAGRWLLNRALRHVVIQGG